MNNGKVSCACCEPECCLYPANQLGINYTATYLPDAVTINWPGRFQGSASKSGSTFASGTVTLSVIDGQWTLSDSSTSTTRIVGNCLLRGDGLAPDNALVEDQFFDCYEVTWSDDREQNGPGSVVLIRSELCVWASADQDWNLLMAPYAFFGDIGIFELTKQYFEVAYETAPRSSPAGGFNGFYYFDLEINAIACP